MENTVFTPVEQMLYFPCFLNSNFIFLALCLLAMNFEDYMTFANNLDPDEAPQKCGASSGS